MTLNYNDDLQTIPNRLIELATNIQGIYTSCKYLRTEYVLREGSVQTPCRTRTNIADSVCCPCDARAMSASVGSIVRPTQDQLTTNARQSYDGLTTTVRPFHHRTAHDTAYFVRTWQDSHGPRKEPAGRPYGTRMPTLQCLRPFHEI